MSTPLGRIRDDLRRSVSQTSSAKLFEAAKERRPVLRAYETTSDVLAVLEDESRARYREKEPLTRAILAELQGEGGPFWSALLTYAYYPVILRLKRRIFGDAIDDDDLDQEILVAFLSQAVSLPLPKCEGHTALCLKQRTERIVFRQIRDEVRRRRHHRRLRSHEEVAGAVTLDDAEDCLWREQMLERAEQVLADPERLEQEDRHLHMDIIVETVARGERIRSYVERHDPQSDPKEMERAYERGRKKRYRSLRRLAPEFT